MNWEIPESLDERGWKHSLQREEEEVGGMTRWHDAVKEKTHTHTHTNTHTNEHSNTYENGDISLSRSLPPSLPHWHTQNSVEEEQTKSSDTTN